MVFETSWDDGREQDGKLADMLWRYKIPATFYVPVKYQMSDNLLKEIAKNFEIGGHTISHPTDLKLLAHQNLETEIMVGKSKLETIIGRPITKFCYPRGRYNDEVVEVVKRAGFTEARTTEVLCSTLPKDQFRKGTTIHIYPRKEYNDKHWLPLACELYELAEKKDNGYFHLWGHSWEIDKLEEWENLESFFEFVGGIR